VCKINCQEIHAILKYYKGCIFITVALNIIACKQMLNPNGVLTEMPGGVL